MASKKRSVDNDENSDKKRTIVVANSDRYISLTVVDAMGGFDHFKIPVERLGEDALKELITAAANNEPMDVITADDAPLCLKRLGIRVGHYESVDEDELEDVKSDLCDCATRTQESEDTGKVLMLAPVFSLTCTNWC